MIRIAYHPAAQAEFEAEVSHCENERVGAGHHVRRDILDTVELLSLFPGLGRPDQDGARRMVTRHYHFIVHYELVDDLIVIFAIAHPAREPGYWNRRRPA